MDVFQRLCFAYDKFFDDIKKGRLKSTRSKKGVFVKKKTFHVDATHLDS
ncbi:MAG: hypothetical protein ACLFMM_09465 [Methanohalobium sp.]